MAALIETSITESSNNNSTDGKLIDNLTKMQDQYDKITSPAAFVVSLPKPVQRRVKALKKLQLETFKIETRFYEELHSLEAKYERLFEPFFQKRFDIVSACVEPTDEECNWVSDEDVTLEDEFSSKTSIEDEKTSDNNVSGIPSFWLQIFKNVEMLSVLLHEDDKPLLKHLLNITSETLTGDRPGFRLNFHFEPNEYFTDRVLTKDYEYTFSVDDCKPLDYDGPEIVACKGLGGKSSCTRADLHSVLAAFRFELCSINWKPGMNLTMREVKKVQQHRVHGSKRTVVKSVPNDSFFNFFIPPEVIQGQEADEETEEILSNDFEIGHFLRDQVIPKAVLFFTGEAVEYSDDELSEDESESDEVVVDHTRDGESEGM